MRIKRWALISAVVLLDIAACSTMSPIGGSTSTSTTTATTTATTGTGTGGVDPSACKGFVDVYDFCGDCRLCLQELCCAELLACTAVPGCINCIANDPKAIPGCLDEIGGSVIFCSQQCERCHPDFLDGASGLDCSPNAVKHKDGSGGTGGTM